MEHCLCTPLSQLLRHDGLTDFGQQINAGTAAIDDLDIDEDTKAPLWHQQSCVQPNQSRFTSMPCKEMRMDSFCKWPERTMTSPSDRHLGTYKLLLKDLHWDKKEKSTSKSSTCTWCKTPPPADSTDVIRLIHQLLCLAVQHCHTFKR